MKHEDIKNLLLKDTELKTEYDSLKPIYEITREIIRMRISKELIQNELAKLIGTKQSAISRLENGSYNPTIDI